jgi:DivIVA domain-containing protein
MTEGRLAPEEVRTRTFTRVVRGYRRREVRRLLERAAADLARLRDGPAADGPQDQPLLTAEEVEEARFQPALGGYEMDEVDTFLDEVVAEMERTAREPFRASALPAPPAQPPFLAATPGPPPAGPDLPPVTQAAVGPPTTQAAVGPPAAQAAVGPPAAQAAVDPPTTGSVGPRTGRVADSDKRDSRLSTAPAETAAAALGPPAPEAPGPAPLAADDEGFFPPPSVPPSAAPAQTPPPPPPRPPVGTSARPLTASEVETRSFERGAPGYLPSHVDLFLAKAARALVGRDGETLTRWDVLRQRFPLGPRGYATNEVDAFLVRLAAQFPDPDPAAQQEILRKLQEG